MEALQISSRMGLSTSCIFSCRWQLL